MATSEFHFFPSLPLELRQEIYLFATPPRAVQVKECIDQEYEDFVEEIRSVPNKLRLDPSLAHFASNWRHMVPHRRQSPLESFGFTSNKSAYRPWTPSSSTPEIPIDWLDENPQIAWELARKSHLYSNAAIPALLHTCRDSRASLMQCGYQLAFRTRSSPPRTWFNFSRDFLFVQRAPYSNNGHKFLSGSIWDFGQFNPNDMQMVQNLAFANSAQRFKAKPSIFCREDLSPVFMLFTGLREVLFAEWTDSNLQMWAGYPPSTEQDTPARDDWACRPVEEIDASFGLFTRHSSQYNDLISAGVQGCYFVAYKREHGLGAPFYEDVGCLMGEAFTKHMNSLNLSELGIPVGSWKAPRFTSAHVLSPNAYKFLLAERLEMAETLCDLQRRWSLLQRSRDSMEDPSPEVVELEQSFAALYGPDIPPHNCKLCLSWCNVQRQTHENKKWWVGEFPLMG